MYFKKNHFSGVKMYFDKRNFNFDFRNYKLDLIGIDVQRASPITLFFYRYKVRRILHFITMGAIRFFDIDENNYSTKLCNLKSAHNFYFFGYWQKYNFYQDQIDTIKKHYQLNDVLKTDEYQFWKNIILSKFSVGIHVRRSDYAQSPNDSVFNILTLDYYQECLNDLIQRKSVDIVVFFTDDVDWVRNCFTELLCNSIIISEIIDNDILEFDLMMNCSSLITANSTFSWWAGSLSNSSLIYAPKVFYKDVVLQLEYENQKSLYNSKFTYK